MDTIPRDVKAVIALKCPDGATWKNIRLISREFRDVCSRHDIAMMRRFSDHLLMLVTKFPDKDWDWVALSRRLPWKYILNHVNKRRDYILQHTTHSDTVFNMVIQPWNWDTLCKRKDIPVGALDVFGEKIRPHLSCCVKWEYIVANPHADWQWENVSRYVDISWDIIKSHPTIPWSGKDLSANPYIGWDDTFLSPWCNTDWVVLSGNYSIKAIDVITHPDLPWNWFELSCNPSVFTAAVVLPDKPWCWSALSEHEEVLSIAIANPNLPWDWYQLAMFADMKTILSRPDIPWDYDALSWDPSITWEYIISRPDIKWMRRGLSSNRSIPIQKIVENLNIGDDNWDWDIEELTYRATMSEIKKYPEVQWSWKVKSRTASWEDIIGNPDVPWDWDCISANPYITWDIIANNQDKPWNWKIISFNKFDGWKRKYLNYFDHIR
jgi:hypothetical protein